MRLEARRAAAITVVAAVVVGGAVALANHDGGKGSSPQGTPSLPPVGSPAPRINGWITAGPSGIKDNGGKSIRLTGVAEGRMNQCKPMVPRDNQAATLQRLGFNTVRLAISWAATEPTPPTRAPDGSWQHHWDAGYLSKVDQAVSVFKDHGIAVILDMHQVRLSSLFERSSGSMPGTGASGCPNVSLPAWVFAGLGSKQQQQAVCDFFTDTRAPQATIAPYEALSTVWQQYSRRYASESTVIAADVYNEPYVVDACPTVQRENLARFYGVVGTAIRQVNPKITLVFQDVAYEAYQRAGLQLTTLPALSNIIYSWHFYPTSWKSGMAALAAHVERARALKVPLWLGEFDAFGAANNNGRRQNPDWQSDLATMMAYCRANNISWALWEYRARGSSLVDLMTGEPKEPLTRYLQSGF
ncbi:MAG: glycoside hydrolase family 5 protein [Mycobacteriales bacterium]